MTFDEAANQSIARLKILRRAAIRARAEFMLHLMSATQAAVAAGGGWVKNGHQSFEKVANEFKKFL